jgi:hypothetical protein
MTHTEIMSTINGIPAGRFFRVKYTSELPVKASYKKMGITVHKIVEATVRTGVPYENIKAVREYKATHEPKIITPRANNWEWVSPNRIKHNTNTGSTCAVFATVPNGGNKRCSYIVTKDGYTAVVSQEELDRDLIIDSYWSRGDSLDVIRTVSLGNILSIKA